MSILPFVPLAEASQQDEANVSFLDLPQFKVNCADKPEIRQQLFRVWDTIRRIKSRRSELEEEWLAIQRMAVLEHDDGKKYNGRSNAYLPVYTRARKTLMSALSKGCFPSDEYMDVVDRENGDSEEAKAAKEIIRYEFECSANIRQMFKPFFGQFVDFGFAVMKRWYRTDKIVKPKRQRVSMTSLANGQSPPAKVTYDEGFTLSNRSVFNVVCYPEWAEAKRDLQIEAERMDVPVSYVNIMKSSKRWLNVDEALQTGGGVMDNFDWANLQTMMDVSSIPGVTEFRSSTGSPVESVIIVEAWFRMILPPTQYAPEEDSTLPVPARAVFVNGVPVFCGRNNFYDQESPFEYGRDNVIAGSWYGSGAGRAVRSLQYLCNDFANQTNDVGIYGLNPVTLINTNYFSGAMDSLRPGKTYRTRDVDKAMKFVSPKVEIVQYGQTLLQQHVTMAQDGTGAPAIMQGTKAASTATSSQILSQGAQSPVQDTVEDLEVQVFIPLMHAAWSLAQQYRSKPFLRTIIGEIDPDNIDPTTGQPATPQPEQVSILPSDINIDIECRFLSSSQAANRQARQQGLQSFTQLLMPLLPILQQQGKTVDPTVILERAWTDGLGNRNFSKVIIPMPQMGMPPGVMGGPPGGPPQPPGAMPPPENQPPVSAVPQGGVQPPGEGEPQPGEGDTMGPMRQMIDQQNAQTGGNTF